MRQLIITMLISLFSFSCLAQSSYDLDEIPIESLDAYYDDQVSTSDAAVLSPEESGELEKVGEVDQFIPEDLEDYPEVMEPEEE